ncbi:hypothetical protein M3223_18320 [Paenibacillus pasadenensis]|uniref:hypothetical protein n=1 Tax=Paenibacillus pasadenensis TaxID=217090 RepID=UPI00203C386B|nr:hypothetical protein [Paenibacillus pasadenensis]MCM3749317.1 hypothetical protein [Paenibacillus pasadenensis]
MSDSSFNRWKRTVLAGLFTAAAFGFQLAHAPPAAALLKEITEPVLNAAEKAELSLPSLSLDTPLGSIQTPEVEADLSSKGQPELSVSPVNIDTPALQVSTPEIKAGQGEGSLPLPSVSLSQAEIESPVLDVKTPAVKADGFQLEAEISPASVSTPIGAAGTGELNVNVSQGQVQIGNVPVQSPLNSEPIPEVEVQLPAPAGQAAASPLPTATERQDEQLRQEPARPPKPQSAEPSHEGRPSGGSSPAPQQIPAAVPPYSGHIEEAEAAVPQANPPSSEIGFSGAEQEAPSPKPLPLRRLPAAVPNAPFPAMPGGPAWTGQAGPGGGPAPPGGPGSGMQGSGSGPSLYAIMQMEGYGMPGINRPGVNISMEYLMGNDQWREPPPEQPPMTSSFSQNVAMQLSS